MGKLNSIERGNKMSVIDVKVENYICTVTFNHPPVNAANIELYEEVPDVFHELDNRDDIKIVVLTGAGKCFCAGNDRGDFEVFTEPKAAREHYDRMSNSFSAIENCKYPVIGAVNGPAMGAGFCYAAVCDLLVAWKDAIFSLPELSVGVIGAEQYAKLLVPDKVARYIAYTSSELHGSDIAKWGGIHRLVDTPEETLPAAYELAAELARQPRRGLMTLKEAFVHNFPSGTGWTLRMDGERELEYMKTPDFKESNAAFREKRLAKYDE